MSTLLTSQKNEVWRIVKSFGFTPNSFEWEESMAFAEVGPNNELRYKDTGYWFRFVVEHGIFSWEFAPGKSMQTEGGGGGYDASWEDMLKAVSYWLSYIKREIEEPDLWDHPPLETGSLWDPLASIKGNTQFTDVEIAHLNRSIGEIRKFILESGSHTNSEVKFVDEKLNYLLDASKRMGRKDWIAIATTILFGITTFLGFDADSARALFRMAGETLIELYQEYLLIP